MSCWIALSLTVPDPNVKYAYQIISEGILQSHMELVT